MVESNVRLYIPLNIQRFAVSASVSCTTNSQDIASNTSNVTIKFTVKRTSGTTHWESAKTVTFTCDGQTKTSSLALPSSKTSASCSVSFTVGHNSDGTKTISYKAKSADTGTGVGSPKASGSTTLATIPRYANITAFSVAKRDETSVTINFGVDATIDHCQYAINDGGWNDTGVGADSRSFNIGNLAANTYYNFKIRVKRADSQLWTETGNYGQSTYAYPYVTTTPNFVVGNSYTISLYNPLSRNCDVRVLSNDNTQMSSGTTTGTSISGFNDSTSIENYYASIPNNASSTYKVRLIVSALGRDTTSNGGTYSIDTSTNTPTFTDFTYADVNATTLALTGNSQTCIKGYSSIKATISTSNKAIAKNNATMTSYRLSIGTATTQANYSDSSAVEMTLDNVQTGVFSVYAIDSRNLSTKVEKVPVTYIDYTDIVKSNSTISRTTSVGEEVTLNLRGSIWNGNFGSVSNSIESVSYKYKTAGESEYTTGTTSISPTLDSDGNFSFTGTILGDTSSGFDIDNTYEIIISVSDKLSTTEYIFALPGGKPQIAMHRDGVSIMGAYIPENGGKLQINGVNIENLLGGGDGTPIGTVVEFAGSTTPDGWLLCDGRSLSKTQYSDLFNVIGYTYGGSGNNFNLPNLKGRVPVGYNSSETEFNTLGKTGGEKKHTLTIDEMPNHAHDPALDIDGNPVYWGGTGTLLNLQPAIGYQWNAGSNGSHIRTSSTGGSQAHNILQPYITVNFIIKAENAVPTPQTSQVTSTYEESANDVYSCNYVNELNNGNVLYDNASGTTGNITLSDAIENYKTFEIYFNSESDYVGIVKYFVYSGATYTLDKIRIDSGVFIVLQEKIQISGTTLTSLTNRSYNTNTGILNDNKVKILKIIGYK